MFFVFFLNAAKLGGSEAHIVLKSDCSEKEKFKLKGSNYFKLGGKFFVEVNSICRFVVTKVGATIGSHKGLAQFQYLFLIVWGKIRRA